MKQVFLRTMAILLVTGLLLAGLPVDPVKAASVDALTYEIIDGQVTITDCDTAAKGDLVVPEKIQGYPVTKIGKDAFRECAALTSVTLPKTVTEIGRYAFYKCSGLTSVVLPDGITTIGVTTFGYCTSLKTVSLPDALICLEERTFRGCTGLTQVSIGKNVSIIESDVFMDCTALKTVSIPESVTVIENAFEGCTALEYNVYEKCNYLGNADNPYHALMSNTDINVTSVKIHKDTVVIAGRAFAINKELCSIVLPSKVVSIGEDAFVTNTKLTDVTIPDGVSYIGNGAFRNCETLETIELPKDLKTLGNGVFETCFALREIEIPHGITVLGINLFWNNFALESITIPDGVTTIEYSALAGCRSLTSLELPESLVSIESYAFVGCTALTSLVIPSGVKSIGLEAFDAAGFREIYFRGDAPVCNRGIFAYSSDAPQSLTAYYPAGNPTWSREVRDSHVEEGWDVTWVPYEPEVQTSGISGNITSFSGVQGLKVELFKGDILACTAVIHGSSYGVTDVAPGDYTLKVSADNGVAQTYDVKINGAVTQDVTIFAKGDVTNDGRINMGDVAKTFAHIRASLTITDAYALKCADATGDGKINMGDVARIFSHVRGSKTLW